MSNEVMTLNDDDLMEVLGNSLYPGAQRNSIKMVVGYCRAAGLDPMQKPVHIVPMWDSKSKSMRDVVMPGIGSYRIQASRSGEYAGMSDAEYGPDITESLGGKQVTYPQWCRVIVKRIMKNGQIAEFAATERWTENYATRGKDSQEPNAMWSKRPYAQLAKCAEAQALRKAFPEFGSQPTSDEMEGKEIDGDFIPAQSARVPEPPKAAALPHYTDEQFAAKLPEWEKIIQSGRVDAEGIIARSASKVALTEDQKQRIRDLDFVPEPAVLDAQGHQDFIDAMGDDQ